MLYTTFSVFNFTDYGIPNLICFAISNYAWENMFKCTIFVVNILNKILYTLFLSFFLEFKDLRYSHSEVVEKQSFAMEQQHQTCVVCGVTIGSTLRTYRVITFYCSFRRVSTVINSLSSIYFQMKCILFCLGLLLQRFIVQYWSK